MNEHAFERKVSQRGKELLTITVEIGNGQKENLVIFENDSAEKVAEEFCQKYTNLDENMKAAFVEQI